MPIVTPSLSLSTVCFPQINLPYSATVQKRFPKTTQVSLLMGTETFSLWSENSSCLLLPCDQVFLGLNRVGNLRLIFYFCHMSKDMSLF